MFFNKIIVFHNIVKKKYMWLIDQSNLNLLKKLGLGWLLGQMTGSTQSHDLDHCNILLPNPSLVLIFMLFVSLNRGNYKKKNSIVLKSKLHSYAQFDFLQFYMDQPKTFNSIFTPFSNPVQFPFPLKRRRSLCVKKNNLQIPLTAPYGDVSPPIFSHVSRFKFSL